MNQFSSIPLQDEVLLSNTDSKILAQLSQGKLVSGEEIGEALGVSRAYVWKRISALKEQGLRVLSVPGEGYRLPPGYEVIQPSVLTEYLTRPLPLLRCCWSLPSTNVAAAALAEAFPTDEFLLLSEMQTAGRGRRGKHWHSPLGADLYLSYKVSFESGATALQGLSLVIGVAIVTALRRLAPQAELSLKWPNDIYYEGRKLSGILVEVCGDVNGLCHAIIGVGVNASFTSENTVEQPVASILEVLPDVERHQWVAAIINEIRQSMTEFHKHGLSHSLSAWDQYDFLKGQEVIVYLGEQSVAGVATGISASGALCVNVGNKLREFYAGEVSVRKHESAS